MEEKTMRFNDLDTTGSIRANKLHATLKREGVNFVSGVPCGVIRHIIRNFQEEPEIMHVPANRESEAIGIVAGAYFANKNPVVYMQNSGLFASSNEIASLLIPYKIPLLMIISYRGVEGEDAVQHLTTGSSTTTLLSSFGIQHIVYDGQDFGIIIPELYKLMSSDSLPKAILLKRGWHHE